MEKVPNSKGKELKTMGARIEYERAKLGMTQQELADKLFVKREKITRIETDIPGRNLSIQELQMLADIFNVSTDYLLGRSTSKDVDNTEISRILGLDDNAIAEFHTIVQFDRNFIFNDLISKMCLDTFLADIAEYINISILLTDIKEIRHMKKVAARRNYTDEEIEKIKRNFEDYSHTIKTYDIETLKLIDITKENDTIMGMINRMTTEESQRKTVWCVL